MNTLTAQAVLQTWELAQGAHPLQRSLALLGAAWPDTDAARWAELPLGARDACLFTLHDALFGTRFDTVVACPACGETLELDFAASELRSAAGDPPPAGPLSLSADGYELDYRLPCSDDLLDIAAAPATTQEAAAARLLARCVLAVRLADAPCTLDDLPAPVVRRLQDEMAARDRGADLRVALACPACAQAFDRRFDIGAYLWDEVDDWAQRTLAEVHALASVYGWSEPQILALSAARRQFYIGMVQA